MSIEIVNLLPAAAWRSFVETHPQGNIFHTPEMFQVFARADGYRPTLWAATVDADRVLALLLPVEIAVLGGPLRRLTTRAVVYGSVLAEPGPGGTEALGRLLVVYTRHVRHRALFTELRNPYDLGALRPTMRAAGFAHEEHLNYLIDLARPSAALWADIKSNAQRNIRKAQKLGVLIEEVTEAAQVGPAYALLKDVYQRIQVPLADESLFRAAFDVLHPAGMFKILLVKAEGALAGALTLLLYKGTIIYWYTGVDKAYAAYRAGDLLVWHVLEWGSANGYQVFDFGGAGRPDEPYGVRDFKAKFGGELVNFGRDICVHAPGLLKLSEAGYGLLRRFL
ncbi:MAG: hypothetical protein CVU38_00270 [Chloroflexi bacterium HGW-Chloroflexi-1]|nr:MAG: hypothetical protein CVU38_00270 [Chloroflexi bacterium HGW-Chloroflexi-1]